MEIGHNIHELFYAFRCHNNTEREREGREIDRRRDGELERREYE